MKEAFYIAAAWLLGLLFGASVLVSSEFCQPPQTRFTIHLGPAPVSVADLLRGQ